MQNRVKQGTSYDVLFAGELEPGADPATARRHLQSLFKLSEGDVEKLFGGRPIAVKRGVDSATASRFREAFAKGGALVRIVPVTEAAEASPAAAAPDQAEPQRAANVPDTSHLQLAPVGDKPLEPPPADDPPRIDVSHLNLVTAEGWTLEDCEPPLPSIPLPDISHLELVEPEEDEEQEIESGGFPRSP